jgi:hypothetical protein
MNFDENDKKDLKKFIKEAFHVVRGESLAIDDVW